MIHALFALSLLLDCNCDGPLAASLNPVAAAASFTSDVSRPGLPKVVVGDPGEPGPYAVKKITVTLTGADGQLTTADVYLPDGPGPFAPVIFAHGLWGNRGKQAGTGKHLASWGFVTVVPDMKHTTEALANAKDLNAYADWVRSAPPALGPLSLSKGVAYAGHSYGGLAATLAGRAPGTSAVVGLDPADNWGVGKDHSAGVVAPTEYVVGDPQLFNQFGNSRDIYAPIPGYKQWVHVKGAAHTDFENSQDLPKNAANKIAMRYMTGFLLYETTGYESYSNYVRGGEAMQEGDKRKQIDWKWSSKN